MHIKVKDGSGDSGEEEDQEAHHPARQAAAAALRHQLPAAALRHQLPAAGGHGLVEQYPSYIRDLTKFQEENARLVTREVGLVHQPRDPVPGVVTWGGIIPLWQGWQEWRHLRWGGPSCKAGIMDQLNSTTRKLSSCSTIAAEIALNKAAWVMSIHFNVFLANVSFTVFCVTGEGYAECRSTISVTK